MRSAAANLAAFDAFPAVSLMVDVLSLNTAGADHTDALLPLNAATTERTTDALGTRALSLSLSSPKSLDADLLFLSDPMLDPMFTFHDNDDECAWGVEGGLRVSITASLDTGLHCHGRHSLEAQDYRDESADTCGDRDEDGGHTDKDDSDSDVAMESQTTPSGTGTATCEDSGNKLASQALELDSSWTMIEMSDEEGVTEQSDPAAVAPSSIAASAPVVASTLSMFDAEETPTPRRTSQRVSAASHRKTTAAQRLIAKSTTKSNSSSTKVAATRVSTTRPCTRLSTAAAPLSASAGAHSVAAIVTEGSTLVTPSAKVTRKAAAAAVAKPETETSGPASAATAKTLAAGTTRSRGRARASPLDPVARVHQRKTKQRGYERNYRGRLRTQRGQDEITWLECEAELRKLLARKQALVLSSREHVADNVHARLLRKHTQLKYEERALKEEILYLRVVDKWLEALDIWGVETETSRDIRYKVNTLQPQGYPTFTHFVW